MSQHFLKNSKSREVAQVGWDKPMQNFYCVISDENEEIVFSNLDKDEYFGKDLSFYIIKLQEFNFIIPDGFEEEILQDKINNVVGKQKNWF